ETVIPLLHHERMSPTFGFAAGWREGFPEPLAGIELQAAELTVAARAVDVAVLDERCGHDAVQAVRVLLTGLLALPDKRRLVGIDAQQQRTVVERGEKKQVADFARTGNRHA